MIQIYPNPYENNPSFFGYPIRNSSLSTFSYLSSVHFDVAVYNDSASQFSAAFVYKCGDPSAWAPFQSAWSVYGGGVTGIAENTLSPWGHKTDVQFNYLNYGANQQSKIKVGYKKGSITSVDIGPYRKNFNSKWTQLDSSSIQISGIDVYDKLVIHINNDLSTPLYVFANPIETPPPDQSGGNIGNYLYVSAGIWEISAITTALEAIAPTEVWYDGPDYKYRLNLLNDYTVYLAPGSYVDGAFSVRGKHNVTFSGPGVIDPGRPYYGNWWTTVGFEATSVVTDESKLKRAPIYSFSSFSEPASYVSPSDIRCIGPTIVNNITYATTCDMKEVDNTKLICLWPNSDGFHILDNASNDPNKYASMTRSFLQTGDDATYVGGNQGGGDCLISGCYFITVAGSTFRTFFGGYNYNNYRNANDYWYSAIDIDCRSYSVPSYNYNEVPLYGSFTNSIFGISPTDKKRNWRAYYNEYSSIAVTNHLFSGIRVENLIDIPVFDIGPRPYPYYDYSPFFGNLSGLIFKDITVSSHPNSKYNWIRENKLIGKEQQYRPHDVSFINVSINNEIVTETNKNKYFVWYNKPIPRDNTELSPTYSWAGSSVVDLYIIIGDSIAAGYESLYSDRAKTNYASLPSTLTGCYLWVPSSTSFEVIQPGKNVLCDAYTNYFPTGDYPAGVAALESTLSWRARQNSGDRDVYVVKYAQRGSMPVSGTSAINESLSPPGAGFNRPDWSVSSSNEMFKDFSGSVTSAIDYLKNQNKHVDLKSVIIFLGTNIPIETGDFLYLDYGSPSPYVPPVTAVNSYKNLSLVSSLIDTEISSLISGIGGILGTDRLDVDLSYTKYIWALPLVDPVFSWLEENQLNYYLTKFSNKVKSFSSIENYLYTNNSLSSTKVPLKIIPYLPPSETYFLSDYVHYNFSGISKITDDIYQILQRESRSVTDPRLNPEVNIQFYPKPAVEIYDNPFEIERTYTPFNNNHYTSSVSSAYYNVSVSDSTLGTYVSSFVYRAGHERFYAPWAENVWSVHGSGNPVGEGYKLGLAPWGPSAAGSFNYTNFGISGPVTVKIDYKRPPRNGSLQTSDISIGPFIKNKQFTIENTSSIIIQNVYPYDKLAVEVKYDTSNPLFVFANPYRDAKPTVYLTPNTVSAKAGAPGDTVYFGPGFYEFSSFGARNYTLPTDDNKVSSLPEWSFSAQDNQTIYIDAGAYIRGNFDTRYASAVNFVGYGVIEPYWLQDWYERIDPVHEEKLRVTAFRSYSTFSDNDAIGRSRHSTVKGPTVVNSVAFFNTTFFRNVDNIKYIGPYENSDGPRYGDYPAYTPETYPDANTVKINSSASYTRSFQLAGDDGFTTPTLAGQASILVSSIYCWSLAASLFRTYDAEYSFKVANPTKNVIGNGFSAFDIDVRNYAPYTYNLSSSYPINNKPKISIIGLWYSPQSNNSYNNNGLNDILISGLRVENPTDIPLFDIGYRYYPFIDTSPELGSEFSDWKAFPIRKGKISNITLADISISSHPSSIGQYVYSNAIFGANGLYENNEPPALSGITLRNVKIDGVPITNLNYNNYIAFENKDLIVPPSILNRAPWMPSYYGSSIVDFYILIGGGIVDGTSGIASELTSYSEYSSIATGIPGCYIFRGLQANATTGEFGAFTAPRFELFRPGKNTIPEVSIVDPNSSMGPEISLFNRLKQNTTRDIYALKLTRPGTIAFSGVSATWGTAAGNWSVSSPAGGTKMYDTLRDWCGSAINILYSQGKIIDFKGAVIMVGDDAPSYVTDTAFTTNLIQTEISSLYYGIRNSISSSSLDVNNLNVIWYIPNPINLEPTSNGYLNYYSSIRVYASSLAEKDYRFNYYEASTLPNELRANGFFYNTSGHLRLGEDLASMLISQTSSVTDPALNPQVNFYFYSLSENVKALIKKNNLWKEVTSWVKVNGEWKIAYPGANKQNTWLQGDIIPPQIGT